MAAPQVPTSWTAGALLEWSFAMGRDNFVAFFGAILLLSLPLLFTTALELGLLGTFINLAFSVVISICITGGTFQAMAGQRPDLPAMLGQLQRPNLGPLLILGLVQLLVIGLSALLILPPLFLLPMWAVAIPAMLVERSDMVAAFRRSADLTRHRRVRILGAIALWVAAFVLAGGLILLLTEEGWTQDVAFWLLGAVAGTFIQPLPAILYVLLRAEQEGTTPAQIAAGLGGRPPSS
jgi:hypothetical protein